MKVVSLIDNLSRGQIQSFGDPGKSFGQGSLPGECCAAAGSGCGVEHGLSLYIELDCGARILFDMGQGSLFAENAIALGIDLSSVDLAVVSHGHYDHAGGLVTFLEINRKAPVYIRPSAFDKHFSVKEYGLKPIGIPMTDARAASSADNVNSGAHCPGDDASAYTGRLIFCDEVEHLPYGITLFSNPPSDFPEPPGNRHLLGPDGRTRDDFSHEQSMIIVEQVSDSDCLDKEPGLFGDPSCRTRTVLFGGCAHRGIANILTRAEELAPGPVSAVFSGMHLASLFAAGSTVSCSCSSMDLPVTAEDYIRFLAESLLSHPGVRYWTMHCTGEEGFRRLSSLMAGRLSYLPCGESVILR